MRKQQGFSLIELLTVMTIMAMLSTVAVTSYYTAIRGMTRRSALKHLANTLILARQRACMEGAAMSVMIFNEATGFASNGEEGENTAATFNPTYVICKQLGRITCLPDGDGNADDRLVDEFTPLDVLFGCVVESEANSYKSKHKLEAIRLYNLTRGKWSEVYPKVFAYTLENRYSNSKIKRQNNEKEWRYEIPAFAFRVSSAAGNGADWKVCDAYGIEVSPPNTLPRGFEFEDLDEPEENPDDVQMVTFQPDGTATGERNLSILEKAGGKKATISIDAGGNVTWAQDSAAWR